MKRLIAAALTATTMTLAACTPTATPDPTTAAAPNTLTSAPTGVSTPDPVESWLSGPSTTTTTAPPASTSTADTADSPTTTSTNAAATTGDVYDAIPVTIPSTITAAGRAAANAAIPVWRDAMRVLDQSLQDPSGESWKAAVYQYVNDPAALQQMSLINTFVKQDIHQVGETGYAAEVFEADKHNVKIRACLDFSKFDVVDADGRSVVKQGGLKRLRRDYWLGYYQKPNAWYLNYVDIPDPAQSC